MNQKVGPHARRLREKRQEVGSMEVEKFIDAVMSIEMHFDSSAPAFRERTAEEIEEERLRPHNPEREFDDLWNVVDKPVEKPAEPRKIPPEPERDLLKFLRDYAPDLADWQR